MRFRKAKNSSLLWRISKQAPVNMGVMRTMAATTTLWIMIVKYVIGELQRTSLPHYGAIGTPGASSGGIYGWK